MSNMGVERAFFNIATKLGVTADSFNPNPNKEENATSEPSVGPQKYEDLPYIRDFLHLRPRPTRNWKLGMAPFCNRVYRSSFQRPVISDSVETVKKLREIKETSIKQRTEEWEKARGKTHITASSAASVLGVGFSAPARYLEEKVQNIKQEVYQAAVQHGIELEPVCETEFSKAFGIKTFDCGLIRTEFTAAYGKWSFGFSPDGFGDHGELLEYKCPFKRKLTDTIPLKYYIQVQTEMNILYEMGINCVNCYYVEYRPTETVSEDMRLAVWHITIDRPIWKWMRPYFAAFSNAVEYFKARPYQWNCFAGKEFRSKRRAQFTHPSNISTSTTSTSFQNYTGAPIFPERHEDVLPPYHQLKRKRVEEKPNLIELKQEEELEPGMVLMGIISRRGALVDEDKKQIYELNSTPGLDIYEAGNYITKTCTATEDTYKDVKVAANMWSTAWAAVKDAADNKDSLSYSSFVDILCNIEARLRLTWLREMVDTKRWFSEPEPWKYGIDD